MIKRQQIYKVDERERTEIEKENNGMEASREKYEADL